MEPLKFKRGPYLYFKKRDKENRYEGVLEDGRFMLQSRLVMMNFLYTNHLPTCLLVHHIDGDTLNDDISNLQLMTQAQHNKIHKTGKGKYGVTTDDMSKYNKVRRANPEIKKRCKIANKKHYDKVRHDPIYMEKQREKAHINYHKRKHDPAFMKKQRDRMRKKRMDKKEAAGGMR